jgi:biopolymer transport protein ExbB
MTLLQLLLKGGWVMLPLLLLSILSLYGLFERILALSSKATIPQAWLEDIYAKIKLGELASAKLICEEKRHMVVAKVLQAGLMQLPQAPELVEKAMEIVGQDEVRKLEKNLTLLGSIASLAPMLGFLGTVLGMIQAFMAMAETHAPITLQLLAGGIYEAMITTATGLIVGIIADISYKYILIKVKNVAYQLQQAANRMITYLPATHP